MARRLCNYCGLVASHGVVVGRIVPSRNPPGFTEFYCESCFEDPNLYNPAKVVFSDGIVKSYATLERWV